MEAAAAAGIRGYKFKSDNLFDFMVYQRII